MEKYDSSVCYFRSHISTAQYLDPFYKTDPSSLCTRPIPETEEFEEHLQSLGVNSNSHVVVYDNCGHCGYHIGGRAWWTLKVGIYFKTLGSIF